MRTSLELNSSNEGSQHMFSLRNKKNGLWLTLINTLIWSSVSIVHPNFNPIALRKAKTAILAFLSAIGLKNCVQLFKTNDILQLLKSN